MKHYLPVGRFERQTGLCPRYVAWAVLDEVSGFLRERMPEDYAAQLARRAEAVTAKHPSWKRRYECARGREYLLMSMRHWLAGVLAKGRPALFRQLPETLHVGFPLREGKPARVSLRRCGAIPNPPTAFVRQFELLTV